MFRISDQRGPSGTVQGRVVAEAQGLVEPAERGVYPSGVQSSIGPGQELVAIPQPVVVPAPVGQLLLGREVDAHPPDCSRQVPGDPRDPAKTRLEQDRKSTRLNSSHV